MFSVIFEDNDDIETSKVMFDQKDESDDQGCISCGPCSYPELTEDHVLTSA